MLILGHAGITLGAATLLAGAVQGSGYAPGKKVSWFTALGSYLDIRLLIVGSLLPDIIDKPVGQYFFRETFSNGRIFSHTLVFFLLIAAAGFFLYKSRRKIWLLTLALGTLAHLILDEIWHAPATLFWPFLGFAFEKADLTGWASNIFQALLSNPRVYVPEAVGLLILLWFGLALVIGRRLGIFVKYGKVR